MTLRSGRGSIVLLLVLLVPAAVSPAGAADGIQTPVAKISLPADNDLFAPGDTVQLDGRGSFDPDGWIAEYRWDLGDGNATSGAQASHAYGSPGNYSITLEVSDESGSSASATVRIFVKLLLGIPLEITPEPAPSGKYLEGTAISLDAFEGVGSTLQPPPARGRIYLWDFGDGTTSTDQAPRHAYSRAGTYNVTLTVFEGDFATRATHPVTVHPAAAPAADWTWAYVAASVVLVVGVAAFLGGTEIGLLMLGPVFIFLYSRIRQDQILDNYTRGQIHGYIIANPGEHYSSIRSALELNNGTLAYHLQRLENENVIKSAMDGTHRRYYPVNMKLPEPEAGQLTEVQRLIVAKVSETPGISQRDIGSLMNLSPSTVNYHVERLVAKGVIRRERAGMRYRIFAVEPVPGKSPAREN